MQKYSVENDLDVSFFEALKQLSHQTTAQTPAQTPDSNSTSTSLKGTGTSNSNSNSNSNNLCLITAEALNPFHVTLECGHKFNYEPLYQEVLRQKGRVGMHHYFEKIGMSQIKCPYCRNMNNALLPFIGNTPHPIIKRLIGINAPASMCMAGVPCSANTCSANAFYEHGECFYCYRHYQSAIKTEAKQAMQTSKTRCVAETQTGKNKGKQCRLNAISGTTMCKIHSKCNAVVAE
jgi:hypothetical protein